MHPKHRQFAAFLTKRRKARKLTMEQLAKAVGVSKSNVHYWESGEGVPRPSVMQQLAEALDVAYEDLFALAGFASPKSLPDYEPYLRATHPDLPEEAVAEAEKFFRELKQRYGEGGDGERDR